MRINNNLMAMNSNRLLNINSGSASKSMEKLSSGYKINHAADDASGLAISEKMRGQIRGLTQASNNAQDGISLIQTADGALDQTHQILQRMRELAVRGSTGTLTDEDRSQVEKEFSDLKSEITDISNTTQFNKMTLLDGSLGAKVDGTSTAVTNANVATVSAQGKTGTTYTITDTASAFNAGGSNAVKVAGIGATGETVTANVGGVTDGGTYTLHSDGSKVTITNAAGESDTLNASGGTLAASTNYTSTKFNFTIHTGSDTVSTQVGIEGSTIAITNGTLKISDNSGNVDVLSTSHGTATGAQNISSSKFGIEITTKSSFAAGGLNTNNITIQSSGAIDLQTGANQGETLTLDIQNMSATALGLASADVSNTTNATAAITSVENAIKLVSDERAQLGAKQNRLEYKINNLNSSSQNLQSAESTIRDVDMAGEMVTYTKDDILQQAAQAMLAKANQAPQNVLQLLR